MVYCYNDSPSMTTHKLIHQFTVICIYTQAAHAFSNTLVYMYIPFCLLHVASDILCELLQIN